MSDASIEYWSTRDLVNSRTVANVPLFRFFGYAGINLAGKHVLEIGFGANRGADLLECQARGATIYAADIGQKYVEDFQKTQPDVPAAVANAGTEPLPFGVNYDIVFHRDMIYYLTDAQIGFHFRSVHENLNAGGYLVFQFIEKDLTLATPASASGSYRTDFDTLKAAETDRMFRGEINPLRKLDVDWLIGEASKAGFTLKATKTVIESYTPDETVFRVDRYLLLAK